MSIKGQSTDFNIFFLFKRWAQKSSPAINIAKYYMIIFLFLYLTVSTAEWCHFWLMVSHKGGPQIFMAKDDGVQCGLRDKMYLLISNSLTSSRAWQNTWLHKKIIHKYYFQLIIKKISMSKFCTNIIKGLKDDLMNDSYLISNFV